MVLLGATVIFGLSIAEVGAVVIGVAYVTSLLRDWRPMKAMRQENSDLRADLERANQKIGELESKVRTLERSTDLTGLQREHAQVVATLERVVQHLDRLDHSLAANTVALELVVKASAIGQALDDHDDKAAL